MTAQHHYVCDHCGTFWTSRFEETYPFNCRSCGSNAIWHFDRTIAALEHAAHIRERRAHQLEAVTTTKGDSFASAPRHNEHHAPSDVRSNEYGSSKT